MSISDTRQAQKFASIAEVAAAETKLLLAEAEKAPEYANQAAASAAVSEAAANEATTAASNAASNATKIIEDQLSQQNVEFQESQSARDYEVEQAINKISPLGVTYPSKAAADAAIYAGDILEGAYFYVRDEGADSIASEYINQDGSPHSTGKQILTEEGVHHQVSSIIDYGPLAKIFSVVDKLGFRQFYALVNGEFGTKLSRITPSGVDLQSLKILRAEDKGVFYQDTVGRRIYIIDSNGVVAPKSIRVKSDGSFGTQYSSMHPKKVSLNTGSDEIIVSGPEFIKVKDRVGRVKYVVDKNGKQPDAGSPENSASEIEVKNSENLSYYNNVRQRYNSQIATMGYGINHVIWYGQSLSTQQEGYPALTKVAEAVLGNLMIGSSIRPSSRTNPAFVPVGNPIFTPMVAVTQTADGSSVMTDAEVSALPSGSPNEGEGGVSAINFLRQLWLKQMSLISDSTRLALLSCCGVNGRTIEQLSKGANPELYNRITQAVQKGKSLAQTEGKSYGITSFCFLQGEWNYNPSYGGVTTRDGYKEKVKKLYSDFVSDFCVDQLPPAMFTYQTSGSFTSDTNDLAIGMAQLDMATEGDNYYGACPSYPFPDKGGHLTCNGYRWMDQQFAKVMFRVLVLGEGWEPLHCIEATHKDNYVILSYCVPSPPLMFGKPYVGNTATDYFDKGFRANDEKGLVPVSSVDIVADTIIKITFSRNISGPLKVWYADKTYHNGNGCVMDSDPFKAKYKYEYTAGSGQQASENISELVGKLYPLNNWAWAQVINSTEG